MVNCSGKDCSKRASYGYKGQKPLFCRDHKIDPMINVTTKICEEPNCLKIANFNSLGEKKAKYCSSHKETGMIDVKNKRCLFEGCKKRPHYNNPGERFGTFCVEHKKPGMVHVDAKRCDFQNCETIAVYALPGNLRAKRCNHHKEENMVDIVNRNKICNFMNCKIRAHYNYLGEKNGIYCQQHKDDQMINVTAKTCAFKDCRKTACFANENIGGKMYCISHAPKDVKFIDVKNREKICLFGGCQTRASYGNHPSRRVLYCSKHKQPDMIRVGSKKCSVEDCANLASYGKLFARKTHCYIHKKYNQYRKNKPKCQIEACDNFALYADVGNYPVRCAVHSLDEDKNVAEKMCQNCKLLDFIRDDLNLCNNCAAYAQSPQRKAKEMRIKNLLDSQGIKYVSHDKTIDSKCSLFRPDFLLDYDYFHVIISVDENQHKGYPCECEQVRMIQLHQDIGMQLIFIRFNPDGYRNSDGKIVKIYGNREKKLLELLEGMKKCNGESIPPLGVIYLYYDGFDGNPKIEEIRY